MTNKEKNKPEKNEIELEAENIEKELEVEENEQNNDLEVSKLKEELESCKKKSDEYLDSLQRNMAEFDNFKKRIAKEKESLYNLILIEVVEKLLPIIDNFETAISSKTKDEEYKKGMQMIHKEMTELLISYGLEEIKDLGETFDPEYHEAVLSEVNENAKEKEITEVFRKGYKIKEKVVRHSLVKVAN